jgi:hypothetical protein
MTSSRTPLNRRAALAVAGSAALVVIVVITALFANLGLLQGTTAGADTVGKLDGTNVGQLVSSVGAAGSGTVAPVAATTATRSVSSDDRHTEHTSASGVGTDADD